MKEFHVGDKVKGIKENRIPISGKIIEFRYENNEKIADILDENGVTTWSCKCIGKKIATGWKYWDKKHFFRKEVSMEHMKFGIKYERETDPIELFPTRKDAEERLKDLLNDRSVLRGSLYLFEIGKIYKIQTNVSYEQV